MIAPGRRDRLLHLNAFKDQLMSMKIAAAAALLGLSLSSVAQAQGFSCGGRLTPDERMVCQDRTLAQLDVQLNQIYERAIAQATP
jgi:uncharacterized protein